MALGSSQVRPVRPQKNSMQSTTGLPAGQPVSNLEGAAFSNLRRPCGHRRSSSARQENARGILPLWGAGVQHEAALQRRESERSSCCRGSYRSGNRLPPLIPHSIDCSSHSVHIFAFLNATDTGEGLCSARLWCRPI
jgi:hypothetical protein